MGRENKGIRISFNSPVILIFSIASLLVLDEGLQSGEIVVTAGVHKLKEGMEVERLKPVADTNIGGLL